MRNYSLPTYLLDNAAKAQVVIESATYAQIALQDLMKISQETLYYSLDPIGIEDEKLLDLREKEKQMSYIERVMFYKNKAIQSLNTIEKLVILDLKQKDRIDELKKIAEFIFSKTVTTLEEAQDSCGLTAEVWGYFEDYYYFDEYATLSMKEQRIILTEFDALLDNFLEM